MKELTTRKENVFRGRIFDIDRHYIRLPNGRESFRDIVKHPGAVAVIPILDDGKIVLVRQYRKAVEKELLEIPAGTLKPGEDLKVCVRRELMEETGYAARKVTRLISFYPAPGYTSEMIHIFTATGLTLKQSCPEEDEDITVETMRLDRIVKMIKEGKITDSKTIVGIFYYHFAGTSRNS